MLCGPVPVARGLSRLSRVGPAPGARRFAFCARAGAGASGLLGYTFELYLMNTPDDKICMYIQHVHVPTHHIAHFPRDPHACTSMIEAWTASLFTLTQARSRTRAPRAPVPTHCLLSHTHATAWIRSSTLSIVAQLSFVTRDPPRSGASHTRMTTAGSFTGSRLRCE